LARRLAAHLRAGDVVLLSGDIGAGKTHFARCVIQALLPMPEDVPSPTYTIVQTYPGPECEIWHLDLYRLVGPNEVFELGLVDVFETAICLIEWPDRLGDLAPPPALRLDLALDGAADARILTFAWQSGDWSDRLNKAEI
jgi:tRNA threonylcarbamoyladenosine biosynthesis protein TsaE